MLSRVRCLRALVAFQGAWANRPGTRGNETLGIGCDAGGMNAPANDTVICGPASSSPWATTALLTLAAGWLCVIEAGATGTILGAMAVLTPVVIWHAMRGLAAGPCLVLGGEALSWHGLGGSRRFRWADIGRVECDPAPDRPGWLIVHPRSGCDAPPLRLEAGRLGMDPAELLAILRRTTPDAEEAILAQVREPTQRLQA
jgi:hypothetical protein